MLLENLHAIEEQIESGKSDHEIELPNTSDDIVDRYVEAMEKEIESFKTVKDFIIEDLKLKDDEFEDIEVPENVTEEAYESEVAFDELFILFQFVLRSELRVTDEDVFGDTAFESDRTLDKSVTLSDVGHPHVLIDAKAKLTGDLMIAGKTNLPEGETIEIRSKKNGLNFHTADDEVEIDENGEFEAEIEIPENELTNEPIVTRIVYFPNEQFEHVYGKDRENIYAHLRIKLLNLCRHV